MDLSTIERIKEQLKFKVPSDPSSDDAWLQQVLVGVSSDVEDYLERFTKEEQRTEFFDVELGQKRFQLKSYPVQSVSEVNNDYDGTFGTSTVIDSSNYTTNANGELVFKAFFLVSGPQVLKVIYTGGMAVDTSDFITKFPQIALAVDVQVAFYFQRKDELGISGLTGQGGSVTVKQNYDLLPQVKRILNKHVNWGGRW